MPETYRAGRNLMTPHAAEAYPGLLVVVSGPLWQVGVIVPPDGATIAALGGERVYAYETVDGVQADGFELRPGDRATLVRGDLPHFLAEWSVARAS